MRIQLMAIPIVLGLLAIRPAVHFQQAFGQTNAASSAQEAEPDQGWPRTIVDGATTFVLYQPQVDQWECNRLNAYAAVEVTNADKGGKAGSNMPQYGVISFNARTAVDKVNRLVTLSDYHITKSDFPGDPGVAKTYEQTLQKSSAGRVRVIALDRLEANLAVTRERKANATQQLNNEPPRIILSKTPAILVPVDGSPELRPVPGQSNLMRVFNTRALILFDNDTSAFLLYTLDGWFTSTTLAGPWNVASSVPEYDNLARDMLVANKAVDVLSVESAGSSATSAKYAISPTIYVSTAPAELLLVRGEPRFTAIANTNLQYVSNTDSDIFTDNGSAQYYVTFSGRWFQAASLNGPWSYLSGKDLPVDFAKIPPSSPKAGVLVSIPGTPQAQEALIANEIPQTAVISASDAKLTVNYDGDPRLQPIEGTRLSYVVNSPTPVILADDGAYYAVDSGVWFTAPAAAGPWVVANSVPDSIYTIPPSSPLHYVTYVRIYNSMPGEVYCGYTPGYFGTVETSDGVVDYGTGYNYAPYVGNSWIGYPATYGYGASFGWNSLSGWSLDFGLGYDEPMYGPWYEPLSWGWGQRYNNSWIMAPNLPSRGRHTPRKHIGFGGIASTNIYARVPGATITGSRPGLPGAARAAVSVYQPRNNNIYATQNGQVFRYQSSGWQQRSGAAWQPMNRQYAQPLQRQWQSRVTGGQRYQNFNRQFGGGRAGGGMMPHGGGGGMRRR